MNKKKTFGEIYTLRFNKIVDNIDPNSVNAGSARSVLGLIPYVLFISFFEYLWEKLTKGNKKIKNNP